MKPGAGHPSRLNAKTTAQRMDRLDRHWALVSGHKIEHVF